MAKYKVLQSWNIGPRSKRIKAARFDLLIDANERQDATEQLIKAAHDLIGDNDAIAIYAYLEDIARQWGGWIARVEYRANKSPIVFFDNNPILREALYNGRQ